MGRLAKICSASAFLLQLAGMVIEEFAPQQATEPSRLTPQVWNPPALTEANSPAGGVAWPCLFQPQQATAPSPFTPQMWDPPALTGANSSAGSGRQP